MDFTAFWLTTYIFITCQFFVTAGSVLLVTRLMQRWGNNGRIQPKWASRRQYLTESVIALRSLAINALCGTIATYGMVKGWFPINIQSADTASWWRITLDCLLLFVAHDAYFYWTHRIMHHKWLFRAVHLEHHLARTPNPITTLRLSVPEAFVQSGFFVLWAYFMPDSRISLQIALAYVIFIGAVGHSGFEYAWRNSLRRPFVRIFTTVTHHDMHHLGGFNSNYGIHLSIWDKLMGTENPNYDTKFTGWIDAKRARRASQRNAMQAAE